MSVLLHKARCCNSATCHSTCFACVASLTRQLSKFAMCVAIKASCMLVKQLLSAEMCLYSCVQKSAGGSSSNGNGSGGEKIENSDGSVTYQDPLDMYCEDNPETDECRSASCSLCW